jgi:hypothetical protein
VNSIKKIIEDFISNYKKKKEEELVQRLRRQLLEYEYKIKLNHLEHKMVVEKLGNFGYKTDTQIIKDMFLLDEKEN